MKKNILIAAITLVILIGTTTSALAYKVGVGDRTSTATDCVVCHTTSVPENLKGPHGGYTTGTTKCAACHTVHKASSSSLLPGATVTAACNYCHDLTGTSAGPYNMTGITTANVNGAHKVQGINGWTAVSSIPGGDAATGGSTVINSAYQGKMSGTTFTCDSCHTPHAIIGTTVEPYLGESPVKQDSLDGLPRFHVTDRLLKKKVNGVTVGQYGTAWCAACHAGRDNMSGVFNHPVYEDGVGYTYLEPGKITYQNGSGLNKVKTQGYLLVDAMGESPDADTFSFKLTNKEFRMTATDIIYGTARSDSDSYANYSDYVGKGPTCQQCHANPRDVDQRYAAGGKPTRFTFPHLSTNKALLVENGDDFCTNCHGPNLP